MKKFLFLILLSSQISAELMSLKCRYSPPPETWYVYTFDKNQGATADVYRYLNGKMDNTIETARLIWNPSSITVKYKKEVLIAGPGSATFPVDTSVTINRETLAYQVKQSSPGFTTNHETGKCNIVEVVKVVPKKVF